MTDIVLSTLNAKYAHPALGLRYLLANLGPLQSRARLLEFDIKADPALVTDAILAEHPRLVGLGVHIWNAVPLIEIAAQLKRRQPDLVLILGGPEMMSESPGPEIDGRADYIIAGEADLAFRDLCGEILEGRPPAGRVFHPAPVDVERLILPYDLYSDEDLSHRITHVESSRGCPYHCDYCLSAGDAPVRFFPLSALQEALDRLLNRGARTFKFVDRTFNLDIGRCLILLTFFLERARPGLFVHFEMVPGRFPPKLREVLARFPAGALQLEIGIQTFNP
ncbi:MAG: cobalamin-dependent protein, partial [Verrucomicrobia bacterium]|nr:cobalamin-dependent protein [Verrucomicrobiota bacterium]